jgi:Domain of unknown function (DUF2760)
MYTEITLTAVITAAVLIGIWLVALYVRSGGDMQKYRAAQAVAARMTRDPEFAARVQAVLEPPPPPPPPKPSGEPLRLLSLLQREGRLLDFLLEDVQAYGNEQIGAAVRDIHRSCHKAIEEHLVLEPVLPGQEGTAVEVPPGFDPSAIRLTGNVTGQPPFRGTLLHHGWRVKEIKLAKPPEGQDEFVVQPAEVELT